MQEAERDELAAIVERCLDAADPELLLGQLCAGRPELAQRARTLIERVRIGERALEARPVEIAGIVLQRELGSGGMGTVYLATQEHPIRRQVAVKVVKRGMDTRQVLARFAVERQALAAMNHDAIAKVYDAGETADGRPYFLMEYVPGIPITEFCARGRLEIAARIRLVREVCMGVMHAHQKGVIHRDLTARNLLVATESGRAIPKIIDFGLARATDDHAAGETLLTRDGQVVGTPEYMSPEQADPSRGDLDTRTDVYSLGVLLYELLVGELPISSAALRRGSLAEIQRRICQEEPARPSARVASLDEAKARRAATERATGVSHWRRLLRGDLDWIVMRCLEKDPARRYESVGALAADLLRYLAHEPVEAGPPSPGYRLRKLVRRHRGLVAAASVVLVAIVAGAIATAIQYLRAEENAAAASARATELGRRTEEFDLLAHLVRLRESRDTAQRLFPPTPELVPELRAWLEVDAARLRAARPSLQRVIARLGRPLDATDPPGETRAELAAESDRFLLHTLSELDRELARFEADEVADVRARLAWAERVHELTVERHRDRWEAVRRELAAADPPIALDPQDGLIPLGANPSSGLQEFYHLRSAFDPAGTVDAGSLSLPSRDGRSGEIAVGDDTGIVFVLVPGGTFTMGAQATDPRAANFDAAATSSDTPHEVSLGPFFIARHETTKGQWARLSAGEQPSLYVIGTQSTGNPEPFSAAHPVEHVDWSMCTELARRHGLALPTEAQWEYACRAGTATPWWCGVDARDLAGCANVLDLCAGRHQKSWGTPEGEFDDGRASLAPVGRYRPNRFGLHDMHGNVREWCQDLYGDYSVPVRAGDGLRLCTDPNAGRTIRGGSFYSAASGVRTARREWIAPGFRNNGIGLRLARALSRQP